MGMVWSPFKNPSYIAEMVADGLMSHMGYSRLGFDSLICYFQASQQLRMVQHGGAVRYCNVGCRWLPFDGDALRPRPLAKLPGHERDGHYLYVNFGGSYPARKGTLVQILRLFLLSVWRNRKATRYSVVATRSPKSE